MHFRFDTDCRFRVGVAVTGETPHWAVQQFGCQASHSRPNILECQLLHGSWLPEVGRPVRPNFWSANCFTAVGFQKLAGQSGQTFGVPIVSLQLASRSWPTGQAKFLECQLFHCSWLPEVGRPVRPNFWSASLTQLASRNLAERIGKPDVRVASRRFFQGMSACALMHSIRFAICGPF